MLFVDAGHQGSRGRQGLVDKDEDGLLGGQLDALADDIDELANGEVGRHEVLLLVDGRNLALLDLLADNLDTKLVGDDRLKWGMEVGDVNIRECDRCTSGGCARPRPCASQRGARP